jgi:hypothetical protein
MPMSGTVLLLYFVFFATLMRALLVRANVAPPICARCGHKLERRELGETICNCSRG